MMMRTLAAQPARTDAEILGTKGPRIVERRVEHLGGYGMKVYTSDSAADRDYARAYFEDMVMGHYEEIVAGHEFGIAFEYGVSGKDGRKIMGLDVLSVRLEGGNWRLNGMVDSWEFEGGKLVPGSLGTVCEAEAIILGMELKLRTQFGNKFAYLSTWPSLGGMGFRARESTEAEAAEWLEAGERLEDMMRLERSE